MSPVNHSVADTHTASVTTISTSVTTTTLVSPAKMDEWAKVAHCETDGNWKHEGSLYEGGLGILRWNWQHFGGLTYAPHAWLASSEQQVLVAMNIQHGLETPDQNGTCSSW